MSISSSSAAKRGSDHLAADATDVPTRKRQRCGDCGEEEADDDDNYTMLTALLRRAERQVRSLRSEHAAHRETKRLERLERDALLARRLPPALHAELLWRDLSEQDGALRALHIAVEPEPFAVDGRPTRWHWRCSVSFSRTSVLFEVPLVGDLRYDFVEPDSFTAVDFRHADDPTLLWHDAMLANDGDPACALAALSLACCEHLLDFAAYPASAYHDANNKGKKEQGNSLVVMS